MLSIPVVIGLAAAGAIAFAAGGKDKKVAARSKPPTHRPKRKAPTVAANTEATIIAAINNPAAMKRLIDGAVATGDASKLWNLGRTILLNSQGNPAMQAVAAQVLANAVSRAVKSGQLGDLIATALANGDGEILAAAAQSAMALEPSLSGPLTALISQLKRAGQPPTQSPGQPRPPATNDEKLDTAAAQKATEVVADAIKKTEQVQTLPEVVITASPPATALGPKAAAIELTTYLHSISDHLAFPHEARFHEDKSKVGQLQKKLGVSADGKYGAGSAMAIASLGVVPIPPFYWPKAWQAKKAEYKRHIQNMAAKFSDVDWSPALKGVDRS